VAQAAGQPAVLVGTKKKGLAVDFKNAGSDCRAKGCPGQVRVHDFVDEDLGKVAPCGTYDMAANAGWASVGTGHGTAGFAVQSVRRWLQVVGSVRRPTASALLTTADGGGSNGPRVRPWKLGLQALADGAGLAPQVCHYPPGTSKWNKTGRRMFCRVAHNWRGKPLASRLAVVEPTAATTTKTGLTVHCELDENSCAKGRRVANQDMAALNTETDPWHPERNCTIKPRTKQ